MIFLTALFVTVALLVMFTITVSNLALFPRLAPGTSPLATRGCPLGAPLAILIPARNEAERIGPTIRALLAQDYPNFSLLVLDDHSTDGTAAVVQAAGQGDPRLHLLDGAALPAGWGGKNWACHQLAQAVGAFASEDFDVSAQSNDAHSTSSGEILVFTDADVIWQPGALSAVVNCLPQLNADLLTVWPTQITVSWGERLVTPLLAFAIWAYLPIGFVHHIPNPSAAAANGQCLVFRRSAYQRCGGHAAVYNEIVEDVKLARRVKAIGMRLRMADGAGLIQTRMYNSWRAVRQGFAKNILAGHGNSIDLLVLSTLFHLAVFVAPWLWLILGAVGLPTTGWPLWPLLLILLGIAIRILTAYATRQRLRDSWLLPLSVLLMSSIAGQAIWWHLRHGGPQWKGRVYGK